MKNGIWKLAKFTMIAGLVVAPYSLTQAQVIVPKAEIPSRVSTKTDTPTKPREKASKKPEKAVRSIEEIAREAAEKSVKPVKKEAKTSGKRLIELPAPTAKRRSDRKESDRPQTNQEIAKQAAEEVVKKERDGSAKKGKSLHKQKVPSRDATEDIDRIVAAEKLVMPPLRTKPNSNRARSKKD